MALDGDSFCGASRKALRLLESHGTLAGLLDEVLADALDLVQLFGTWALVLVAIYLGRSAGVWSLTGGSNLEEGFLESLAGRLLGFVASALAGFVAAMALLAPVCRFVEASAHTLLVVVLTKEGIEYFLQT